MGNFNPWGRAMPPFGYTPGSASGPQPLLANPARLFGPALQRPQASPAAPRLNQVSSLLGQAASFQSPLRGMHPGLHPLFQAGRVSGIAGMAPKLVQIQQRIVSSGLREWQQGVRETNGSNRGARIDQYAANSSFGPGYAWCGFFAAWNYSQAGFKSPESFASYQKARDFFLYRSYTSRDASLNRSLDQLRLQQQASGSSREYFIMAGSPTYDYVKSQPQYYGHVDLASMTHSWQDLPLAAGDVALFSHGHVGTVVSYDRSTGRLETVEGNASGIGPDGKFRTQAVVRKSYDLSKAADRALFDGFGRAALGDFSG